MRFSMLVLTMALITSAVSQSGTKPFYNVDPKGLWVEGYDPVAYSTDHKAVKGKAEYTHTMDGARFQFANVDHLARFKADPQKYLPQYGGWCAYAMGATNEKVEVDPETFKIKDGKLYLFYNAFFNNTLTDWNKDEARLMRQAEANWRVFEHKN